MSEADTGAPSPTAAAPPPGAARERRGPSLAPLCLLVFAVALALRLGFVLTLERRLVFGDEVWYAERAVALGRWVRTGEISPVEARNLLARGPLWTATECAAIAATADGGLAAAGTYGELSGSFNWQVLRCFQAVLDAATCALIAAAAGLLFDRRTAALAGLATALHPARIIFVERLLPQVEVGACLAAALLALAAAADHRPPLGPAMSRGRRRWLLAAAGAATALAGQFLPEVVGVPLVLAWLPACLLGAAQDGDDAVRGRLRAFAWILAGCAAIWVPRWVLLRAAFGYATPGTGTVYYVGGFWQVLDSAGWFPDNEAPAARALAQGGRGALAEAVRTFFERPLLCLWVYAGNVVRIWQYPSNTLRESFVLDFEAQTTLHQLLGLFTLGTAPAMVRLRPASALLAAPILLLTAGYALEQAETRYVLPALPLVLALAAAAVVRVADAYASVRLARAEAIALLAGGVLLVAASTRLTPQVLTGCLSPREYAGASAGVAVWLGAASAGLLLAARGTLRAWTGARGWAYAGATLVAGATALGLLGTSEWRAWSVDLGTPPETGAHALRTVIRLGEATAWAALPVPPGKAYLLIDAEGAGLERLEVTANGVRLPPQGSADPPADERFHKDYRIWLDRWDDTPDDVRQWHACLLPTEALATGRLEVVLRLPTAGEPTQVTIHGDAPEAFADGAYAGPCIGFGDDCRSLQRWVWSHRDPRLDGVTPLFSAGTRSARYDGERWDEDDLSPDAGRQSGAYRIRVLVLPPGVEGPSRALPAGAAAAY